MARRIRIRAGVGEPGEVIFAPARDLAIAENWHMAGSVSDALVEAAKWADDSGAPQVVEVTVEPDGGA